MEFVESVDVLKEIRIIGYFLFVLGSMPSVGCFASLMWQPKAKSELEERKRHRARFPNFLFV